MSNGEHTMSDYRTSTSAFRDLIDRDGNVSYFVPLSVLGEPADFANLGMDGLNEKLADDHVENGYALANLVYTFEILDGVAGIRVKADASEWEDEQKLNDLSEAQRLD